MTTLAQRILPCFAKKSLSWSCETLTGKFLMKMVEERSYASLWRRIASSLSTYYSSTAYSSYFSSIFSLLSYLISSGPLSLLGSLSSSASCDVRNLCLLTEKSRTMVLPLKVDWLSCFIAFSQER
jgi:hypothetical protein